MVTLPRSVLVGVDFGGASAAAVAVGGTIVERCQPSTLRLLHAESMDAPAYFTSDQIGRLERDRQELLAQADAFLARFGRQHTPTGFSTRVVLLPPVDAILRESEASDLIVMGTHGRHGPSHWWLGSVAERVLREIARLLLIVRAGATGSAPSVFERALIPAAPAPGADGALEFGRELTRCLGGAVLDRRQDSIEAAIEETRATMAIVALPEARTPSWLSNVGEPLVRSCSVPILFIPAIAQGAWS